MGTIQSISSTGIVSNICFPSNRPICILDSYTDISLIIESGREKYKYSNIQGVNE